MKNLLVAQSGGPTAAINATLAGVVECALSSGQTDKIYGAVNGIEGVLSRRFIDLRQKLDSTEKLSLLCQTPAAALGSCRLKIQKREQLKAIAEILKEWEISCFVYIGGNDSMDTVDQLSAYLAEQGITDIAVVGAPKTVDNDLMGTDHCPGFGSAAKYIAATFSELERDCHVYTAKSVTIVEIMGRNAGWLTASSALARVNGSGGPDLIYLCERPFDTERFLSDLREKLERQNSVLAAVSEGIRDAEGRYISEQVQSGALDNFGHAYIAGAGKVLEQLVRERIGCKVRSIELSLMQRSAAHIASATDIAESRMIGIKACQCALEGRSGQMAAVIRESSDPYRVSFRSVPVREAANAEKKVPDEWITPDGCGVTDEMLEYLKPLIQGEPKVEYRNGIPAHISLYP